MSPMALRRYTDQEIEEFRTMPKRVTASDPWLKKPQIKKPRLNMAVYRQRTFTAKATEHGNIPFRIYQRHDIEDPGNFSCGIELLNPEGSTDSLMLARYNGSNHNHGDIKKRCHIHRTTAKGIAKDDKYPDNEAHPTDRYATLAGALLCLARDYNIKELATQQEDLP